MWGPYSNISQGCEAVQNGEAPIQYSYSISSSETIGLGINGGSNSVCSGGQSTPSMPQTGEVYVVMITNWDGNPGTITLNQTNSNNPNAGSTNCDIINCDIQITHTVVSDTCSNSLGSITINITDANGNVTYQLLDNSNNIVSSGTTNGIITLNNIESGNYTIELEDDDNCTLSESISVNNFEPTYNSSKIDVSCNGGNDGSVNVTMDPNIGNVTYQWNDSNNQITQIVNNLSSGTYQCTISSDYGCSDVISVIINEPSKINFQVVKSDVSCNGNDDGYININNINGGVAPYNIIYMNDTVIGLNDLIANNYTLTIVDNNGCSIDTTIIIEEPAPLIADINIIDETCPGSCDGKVLFNNINPPFDLIIGGNTIHMMVDSLFDLCKGNYQFLIIDNNGCIVNSSFEIKSGPEVISDFTYYNPDDTTIILNNTSSGYDNFIWNLGDGNFDQNNLNLTYNYPYVTNSYSITLYVENSLNNSKCFDTKTILFEINEPLIYYVSLY